MVDCGLVCSDCVLWGPRPLFLHFSWSRKLLDYSDDDQVCDVGFITGKRWESGLPHHLTLKSRRALMNSNSTYRTLTEKLLFQQSGKGFNVPDSALKVVSFAFTEDEARIAIHLGAIPRSSKVIARKARLPLHEVEPILKSLADRVLIVSSIGEKDKPLYGLLPLLPGILEAQIMWSKFHDEEYGKQFAPLAEDFYNELGDLLRPALEGRERFEIGRVIPVEKTITENARISTIAFPSDLYSEIIDRNNSFALIACPCRTNAEYLGNGCTNPKDVCSAMGLIADFVVDKGIARRASKEEFLDARVRAAEAGLVNLVDNLRDPMQVCSCCSCCSGALRLLTKHNLPALFADSHFEPVVDTEKCEGCGQCMEWCQLDAMSLRDEQAVAIDYNRCIGCGVCVSKCDENAISLKEKSNYQPPPDSVVDHGINRYLEYKNYDKNGFLPKVGLGMGRLISNFVQPKLTGPKYKPSG